MDHLLAFSSASGYNICVYVRYVRFLKGGFLMLTTRVFQNGNSQALRIPQEMRTDKKDFFIRKVGDIFIAYPVDDPWAPVRPLIGTFPQDFMADREQPAWDAVPDREGL